jgi:O-antigen ligase
VSTPVRRTDDWPYTTRLLPWCLAGFVVMLWVVPFDNVKLYGAPIDLSLDRIGIMGMGALWVVAVILGDRRYISFKPSGIHYTVAVFVAICFASLFANVMPLSVLDEWQTGVKQILIIVSFAVFYLMVTSIVRPAEVPNFIRLIMALACITALGLVWEYRSDHNLFYDWAGKLFPHPFDVLPEPANEKYGRRSITGPTGHGIAAATMLAMAIPFTLVNMIESVKTARKWRYGAATALLLMGAVATQRKTGLVVPAAAVFTLVLIYRQRMLKLIPAGIAIVIAVQVAAPGALVGIKAQLTTPARNNDSTVGRTADYDATRPDILTKPVLGRGFGTYAWQKYRFIDNEYLKRLIETGVLGFLGFIAMIVAVVVAAIRGRRRLMRSGRGSPFDEGIFAASAAMAIAFATAAAVFDELFFPQAPYVFFLIAGLLVAHVNGVAPPPRTPQDLHRPEPAPAAPVAPRTPRTPELVS